MRRKVLSIMACFVIAGAAIGFSEAAASGHVGSETLITESAVPVAEGEMDVEFGMTYLKANSGKRGVWTNNWARDRRDSLRVYEWTLQATMGVAPDVDVSIATGWVDVYDRQLRAATGNWFGGAHGRGMDDLEVSARIRLLEENGLSVAYIPGMTIPTGRHTNISRQRFGPGQNYWTLDQRVAVTQEIEDIVINADIGYSLPFGRTRRTYDREVGTLTQMFGNKASERGVLDANAAVMYAEGPVRPLVELNYAHNWRSRANDSDQIHATLGSVITVDEQLPRVKVGYQHPIAGRNAARTRRFLLSMAYAF